MNASPQDCQLKVRLPGISSMTWQRVLVPASTTLRDLHGSLKAAAGREGIYLFLFDVHAVQYGSLDLHAAIPGVVLQEFRFRENDRPERRIQLQGGSHHWFKVRISTCRLDPTGETWSPAARLQAIVTTDSPVPALLRMKSLNSPVNWLERKSPGAEAPGPQVKRNNLVFRSVVTASS